MLLDSLKPDSREALCEQIASSLAEVEHELKQYDRALASNLDESQRSTLEQLRARRARTARMLHARLEAVRHCHYQDEPMAMMARTLHVA